jgi:RNase H-like domain found in reverse transcriptase/Reverse transcriptase (RNA-dependent DNA polymerase)
MPRIDDILAQMQDKPKFFTVMDLFSGFHQVRLTDRAIERSTFVTPFGQWEYLQMPFGLRNAPTAFQKMMQDILNDLLGKTCFVFIDDIVVFTNTFQEHLNVLREIFTRLRKNGLCIKPKKCTFASHEIHLLGHIVDKKGIRTDPGKIKAVVDFPIPKNRTDVRAFMGLAGYYRNFVKHFSLHADKINKTLRKANNPFVFNKEAEQAFQFVKTCLTQAPCLRRPDLKKDFSIHTDACSTGFGAILSQVNSRGENVVISYASRATNDSEKTYGATDLELRAVVWALKHFKQYLLGREFKLYTDHSAIKDLFNKPEIDNLLQARWINQISHFPVKIIIKPGKQNQAADSLSRSPHFIENLPKRGLNLLDA